MYFWGVGFEYWNGTQTQSTSLVVRKKQKGNRKGVSSQNSFQMASQNGGNPEDQLIEILLFCAEINQEKHATFEHY